METNQIERRAHPRSVRQLPLEILNMGDDPQVPLRQELVAGETLDVSAGGLRIRIPYNVRAGAEMGLIVGREHRFGVFLARVAWKMIGDNGAIYGLSAPRFDPALAH